MNEKSSERVGPMLNPPHLGELIRENMEEVGWNVTETADVCGAPVLGRGREAGVVLCQTKASALRKRLASTMGDAGEPEFRTARSGFCKVETEHALHEQYPLASGASRPGSTRFRAAPRARPTWVGVSPVSTFVPPRLGRSEEWLARSA